MHYKLVKCPEYWTKQLLSLPNVDSKQSDRPTYKKDELTVKWFSIYFFFFFSWKRRNIYIKNDSLSQSIKRTSCSTNARRVFLDQAEYWRWTWFFFFVMDQLQLILWRNEFYRVCNNVIWDAEWLNEDDAPIHTLKGILWILKTYGWNL